MRPVVRFVSDELLERIVAEARDILAKLGATIHNEGVLRMLADHSVRVDADQKRAFLNDEIIDRALSAAPSSFKLYDVFGRETHDLSGHNVYFTPGSVFFTVIDGKPTSLGLGPMLWRHSRRKSEIRSTKQIEELRN